MEVATNHNPEALEALLLNIFRNISSLKSAYIQLRVALTPYDPRKILTADKLVLSLFTNLSELKHFYRKLVKDVGGHNTHPTSREHQELRRDVQDIRARQVYMMQRQSQMHDLIVAQGRQLDGLMEMMRGFSTAGLSRIMSTPLPELALDLGS